jgi:hypothetical protein
VEYCKRKVPAAACVTSSPTNGATSYIPLNWHDHDLQHYPQAVAAILQMASTGGYAIVGGPAEFVVALRYSGKTGDSSHPTPI